MSLLFVFKRKTAYELGISDWSSDVCSSDLVRPLTRRLDGIDLSPRMVDHARQRRIYDELQVGEIVALLQDRPEAYDLMLAADVLSYFGDLRPLFEAAHAALRNDGAFVATVEPGAETGRSVATSPAALRQ